MTKTTLLFLVIFIEGYVVLACELLAIRQLIPFVGSGVETTSILISAVLLPLAVGYHWGGYAYGRHYRRARHRGRKSPSVRKLLLKNTLNALAILTLGVSYLFLEVFFTVLNAAGIQHRLWQTTVYSLLFLVVPVFLLGQTVPLVSNYFSRRKLSEITGKMLFFSTTGSFLGSVFSTIVLMMTIGVHNTVIVTLGLLCALIFLLARRRNFVEIALVILLFALVWALNNGGAMRKMQIVSDNAYNLISIKKLPDDSSLLLVNRSPSSRLGGDGKTTYHYVQYLESLILNSARGNDTPRDMLVIGAGGFTFGLNDKVNRYTYVDIDPALQNVAEEHFLKRPLDSNKTFIPASAREFVHNHEKLYDFILIDVYTNVMSTPMECTSREFLLDVKQLLKPEGVLVLHTGTSPAFEDKFTVRYDNTFASVFPAYTRQVMGTFDLWPDESSPPQINIVLYMYFNRPLAEDTGVYTDDKNTYSLDRP